MTTKRVRRFIYVSCCAAALNCVFNIEAAYTYRMTIAPRYNYYVKDEAVIFCDLSRCLSNKGQRRFLLVDKHCDRLLVPV